MQRKFIPYKGTQAARPEGAEALSPGQRPGLRASAPSGRAAFGAGLQPVHKPLAKLE